MNVRESRMVQSRIDIPGTQNYYKQNITQKITIVEQYGPTTTTEKVNPTTREE